MSNCGIYFTFTGCYGNQNGRHFWPNLRLLETDFLRFRYQHKQIQKKTFDILGVVIILIMRKENVDVVGDKPVKNDTGEVSMSEEAKQNAWAEHYERLLNVEFDWDPDHLSNEPPLEGPPIPITIDMVKKAISEMKSGKAAGPSGIVELWR